MSMNNNKAILSIDDGQIDEHLSEIHTCSYCKVKFINLEDLKSHSQLHNENKHFTCLLCKEVFSEFQQLKLHDLRHSLEEANEESIDLEHLVLPFGFSRCHVCGGNFSCDEELFNHCVTHKENMEKLNMPFNQRIGDESINSDSSESSIKEKEINYRILRQEMIKSNSGNIYIRLTLIDHKNDRVEEFTRMIQNKIKTKKRNSGLHVKKNKASVHINKNKSEFRVKVKNLGLHVKDDIYMKEEKSEFHVKMKKPGYHVKEKIPVFRAKEMKPNICIKINKPISQVESKKPELFVNSNNPIFKTESKKPKIFVKEKKAMLHAKRSKLKPLVTPEKLELQVRKRKSEYYGSQKPVKQRKTNDICDSEVFINNIQNGDVDLNSEKDLESETADIDIKIALKPDNETGPLKHARRSKLLALQKKIWKPGQSSPPQKISNVCHICHKSFISSSQFVRHLSEHKKLVSYNCSKCTKRFQSETLFRRHTAMYHSEEGQFLKGKTVCSECHRIFNNKGNFLTHKCSTKHNIECKVCKNTFSRFFHLRRHLLNVHKLNKDYADSLVNSVRLKLNTSSPTRSIKARSQDTATKSNDLVPQDFKNKSGSFANSKSQEIKKKDRKSKLLEIKKKNTYFTKSKFQNKKECKKVSEIESRDIKEDSISEDIKIDSGSEDIKIDSRSEDIKIDSVFDDIKTDSVSDDIKTDSVSDDIKIDSVSDDIKTDSVSDDIKTDSVSDDIKIESISEDIKTELVSDDIKTDSITENVKDNSNRSAGTKSKLIKKRSRILSKISSRTNSSSNEKIINRDLNLTRNTKPITRGKTMDKLAKKKINSSITTKSKNAKVSNIKNSFLNTQEKSKYTSSIQKKSRATFDTQKKSTSNIRKKSLSNTQKKLTSNTQKSASNIQKKSVSNIQKKLASNIQKKLASNIQKKLASDTQKESKIVKKPILRNKSGSVTNKKSENEAISKSSTNKRSKNVPMSNIVAKTAVKLRKSVSVPYQSKGNAKKTALKSLIKPVAKKGTSLKNSIASKKISNLKMKKRVQPKRSR